MKFLEQLKNFLKNKKYLKIYKNVIELIDLELSKRYNKFKKLDIMDIKGMFFN